MDYLSRISRLAGLHNSIYYCSYRNSKDYTQLMALSIAKAVLAKRQPNYNVRVIIDGLNDREQDIVRKELKKLRIRYKQIRGMKDEQSVFLRLADAVAGLVRDSCEGQDYAVSLVLRLKKKNVLLEI